jgi:hypothetical protein
MTAVVAVIVGGLFITVFRTRSPQSYTDWTLQASNQTRGDASVPPTLKLPFAQDALRIKLVVPASARTASGLEVQLRDGNDQRSIVPIAARDAETVTVILPKSELKPGKNALALLVSRNGGPPEPLADLYYFNVE